MAKLPPPGCCNSCHEPVTADQDSVRFEGPNLRYPEMPPDSAVFHTADVCRWDARNYDEVWAVAADRPQKFAGWFTGEVMLRLIEATADVGTGPGVPVTLLMTGGAYDGARMAAEAGEEITEVYYVEPVPRPRAPEPGVWYAHSDICPCGAAGTGVTTPGEHNYLPLQGAAPVPDSC